MPGSFDSFFQAIMGQESGGNFRAVNSRTGAMGAYQILPSNIRPWSRQYLGYEVTPSQFLNNASLQTKLARAVLSAQFNRYGAGGAASWWYSGSASNVDSTRSSHGEPSVSAYVKQVLARMGGDFGIFTPGAQRFSTTDNRVGQSSLGDLLKQGDAPAGPAGLAGTDRGALGLGEAQAGLGLESPDVDGVGMKTGTATDATTTPTGSATPVLPASTPPSAAGNGKWFNPVGDAKFTSPYGMRNGRMHTGSDWAMPIGTALRSMADGVVTFAGKRGGKGNAIVIRYSDGTESIYAHMNNFAAHAGQRVSAGELVGYSGNTGNSTGPHLHLEISRGGRTIDPLAWMRAMGIIG